MDSHILIASKILTMIRLDRAVATHLPSHESDHLPIVLQTQQLRSRRGKKGFKFEENWLLWEECDEVVSEAWVSSEVDGHGLEQVQYKIKKCSEVLSAWGSTKTNPKTKEIKQFQKRLEVLNMEETIEVSRAEFLGISKTLDDLLLKQEVFWAQRSRVV